MDRNFRSGGNSACKKRQRKGRNRVQKHMDPAKLARVAGSSRTPLRIEAQGGKVMTKAALARERAELKTRLAKINAIASSPRRGGVLFSDFATNYCKRLKKLRMLMALRIEAGPGGEAVSKIKSQELFDDPTLLHADSNAKGEITYGRTKIGQCVYDVCFSSMSAVKVAKKYRGLSREFVLKMRRRRKSDDQSTRKW